jgi:hypothetical protein
LPDSAVAAELKRKQLVCVGEQYALTMEIRLYREKAENAQKKRARIDQLWAFLATPAAHQAAADKNISHKKTGDKKVVNKKAAQKKAPEKKKTQVMQKKHRPMRK